MNIVGNNIRHEDIDNDWSYKSLDSFVKNKKFSFLNIVHFRKEKYRVYYILAEEEKEKFFYQRKMRSVYE